ncbi:substrate-binding domain-containing protein [Paracoccus sp. R12_1]|uniref:substrate-binding domain-containing protein n=1 Tax=unclassified Paracoccus (in: a-proteobacteria) TaxID=2688777 RepID=UPI001ADC6DBF|nr:MULTISPECIES: substrate-binding domain-containing protein [unclassified Paracoccus (in: a-proteobacteria)]MBO9456932.1 substrate-binding domain-containing protein [Paracoccus sp. R12_2]MBO9488025.1 substrate-binding domain-containing protein [Paracoccus sp. R12_1]
MKRMMITAAFAMSAFSVHAQDIGVAMAQFDNNFLTILREGIEEAGKAEEVTLQFEDAQNDVPRQLSQIQNFISLGVDAIIVVAVDSDAITQMNKMASEAGIPIVNINREPPNVDNLGALEAFVGSREVDAGTIQAAEACRLVKEKVGDGVAKGVILAGDLFIQAGRVRTETVQEYVKTPACNFVQVEDTQVADWSRSKAADLVSNWLTAGLELDVIFANNDEMAIGAAQALNAAGVDPHDVVVAGIDATPDALMGLEAGDIDLTVFQDAAGQGRKGLEIAAAMARGEEPANRAVYIPFELVTAENADDFSGN